MGDYTFFDGKSLKCTVFSLLNIKSISRYLVYHYLKLYFQIKLFESFNVHVKHSVYHIIYLVYHIIS